MPLRDHIFQLLYADYLLMGQLVASKQCVHEHRICIPRLYELQLLNAYLRPNARTSSISCIDLKTMLLIYSKVINNNSKIERLLVQWNMINLQRWFHHFFSPFDWSLCGFKITGSHFVVSLYLDRMRVPSPFGYAGCQVHAKPGCHEMLIQMPIFQF